MPETWKLQNFQLSSQVQWAENCIDPNGNFLIGLLYRSFVSTSLSSSINCVLSDLTTVKLRENDLVRTSSSSDGDWDVFELSTDPNCSGVSPPGGRDRDGKSC
jgi:hypothetical protein